MDELRKFADAIFFVLALNFICFSNALAQEEATISTNESESVEGKKLLAPRSFGFEFDPAYVQKVEDQVVSVRDETGERITARLYCRGTDNFGVVFMPDGQLKAYPIDDIQLVDEKFKPLKNRDIGKSLQKGILEKFEVENTKNYVFLYNSTRPFFDVTKKILESMHDKLHEEFKDFDVHTPEFPLVVILFANKEQFQAFRPMPDGIVAYYNMVTNHIVLYEPSGTRADIGRAQAFSTIAHEGAHQILHNIGIQKRLSMWPMWLSEGLAEYCAPTIVSSKNRWKGVGFINDLRMFELEDYLQARELEGLDGSTIRNSVGAARLNSTGYATAWSIVHYLAQEEPEKLDKYIKYISQLGPFEGMASKTEQVAENIEHYEKFFTSDFKDEESKLIAHLKKQKYNSPMAASPHYVTTVAYDDQGEKIKRGCIYHRQAQAAHWLDIMLKSLTDTQRQDAVSDSIAFPTRNEAARYLSKFLR